VHRLHPLRRFLPKQPTLPHSPHLRVSTTTATTTTTTTCPLPHPHAIATHGIAPNAIPTHSISTHPIPTHATCRLVFTDGVTRQQDEDKGETGTDEHMVAADNVGTRDLASLAHLDEATILSELKLRYGETPRAHNSHTYRSLFCVPNTHRIPRATACQPCAQRPPEKLSAQTFLFCYTHTYVPHRLQTFFFHRSKRDLHEHW
jgi:hypothetical protein